MRREKLAGRDVGAGNRRLRALYSDYISAGGDKMTQRDKIVRMAALTNAALAACVLCRHKKQLNHLANDEAYHPWDGLAYPVRGVRDLGALCRNGKGEHAMSFVANLRAADERAATLEKELEATAAAVREALERAEKAEADLHNARTAYKRNIDGKTALLIRQSKRNRETRDNLDIVRAELSAAQERIAVLEGERAVPAICPGSNQPPARVSELILGTGTCGICQHVCGMSSLSVCVTHPWTPPPVPPPVPDPEAALKAMTEERDEASAANWNALKLSAAQAALREAMGLLQKVARLTGDDCGPIRAPLARPDIAALTGSGEKVEAQPPAEPKPLDYTADSPNSVPPQLAEFEARGYERINRDAPRPPAEPVKGEDE